MISFTQGDDITLELTAQDQDGTPINLTGATFSTEILGEIGVVEVFGNSQHTIVNAAQGMYSLTLNAADTQSCGLGSNKDIVTRITQSSLVMYLRGQGILTVYPPVPLQ